MTFPDDYWSSYEHQVSSLEDFLEAARTISAYQAATKTRFIWRGVKNAGWGLHSRLFRAYRDAKGGATPNERQLRAFEEGVIEEAREWSLDWHTTGGRLSALELLAALQHYGVPTRLLDFSFGPLVALWFAVEEDGTDEGRIFAIDISTRSIAREQASQSEPWWLALPPRTDTLWTTQSWAWRPPPIEPRIARQEACFLMGGVPSTQPRRNYRVGKRWDPLHAKDVRECMSIPFQLITYDWAVAASKRRRPPGRPPEAVYAFSLKVVNKAQLQSDLSRTLGFSHRSLFPDLPGLNRYGRSWR